MIGLCAVSVLSSHRYVTVHLSSHKYRPKVFKQLLDAAGIYRKTGRETNSVEEIGKHEVEMPEDDIPTGLNLNHIIPFCCE